MSIQASAASAPRPPRRCSQLQQLWHTMPARMPRQGLVAGVAAGFAERYDIHPRVIRTAFAVTTFLGGAGLVLYLTAWLLLPPGNAAPPPRRPLLIALVAVVAVLGFLGMLTSAAGLAGYATMMAGWWLLYLRRPHPASAQAAPQAVAVPPDADLLAVPPLCWDLPEINTSETARRTW